MVGSLEVDQSPGLVYEQPRYWSSVRSVNTLIGNAWGHPKGLPNPVYL